MKYPEYFQPAFYQAIGGRFHISSKTFHYAHSRKKKASQFPTGSSNQVLWIFALQMKFCLNLGNNYLITNITLHKYFCVLRNMKYSMNYSSNRDGGSLKILRGEYL